ncbi:hypothetical protein AGABI2DRAFT_180409 [Agaricus bisporus var. bisporus H97]|uniref:hypothetical protein n=1 Tax=Agaricus bisporus var. bisporus (strain H97 / ATCC MYA-4626 / FGSC 10389) TaxID=936046 RepID=UPI00029F583E|nr:hypothetical protein AGABI2DRAFT_180409 [Agaricus bisporus var. bisporus H97]EKV44004.1 hypothetical protein AGABI2DRAFT_180409 [Agaricus bisporus var. bisporus H97]
MDPGSSEETLPGQNWNSTNPIASPPFRHAAPSAPWPWVDIDDGYPGSRFPNWTNSQVKKSKIDEAITRESKKTCVCHRVDIDNQGHFRNADTVNAEPGLETETWQSFLTTGRPSWSKTRAIFVERMSGSILQMLGTRYNIEPFFFSSSLNWIPSRFQADLQPGVGDSITFTLVFLRSVPSKKMPVTPLNAVSDSLNNKLNGSPDSSSPTTTICQSVYWQKMLQESNDPTLVLLIYLWHAMYSWDQALEHLYSHIRHLESNVNLEIAQSLHVVRAHQLFYASLLDDFRERVEFIRHHKNPATTSDPAEIQKGYLSKHFLERECDNLKLEITRLNRDLIMQEQRLKNIMKLVFSDVNIKDSKQLKEMTEAAVRDSTAMKQIAYLTMAFLPATFVAGIFGMNTKEVNPEATGTLPYYVAFAVPLTLITIWIIIAFQSRYLLLEKPFVVRLGWPYYLMKKWWSRKPETKTTDSFV